MGVIVISESKKRINFQAPYSDQDKNKRKRKNQMRKINYLDFQEPGFTDEFHVLMYTLLPRIHNGSIYEIIPSELIWINWAVEWEHRYDWADTKWKNRHKNQPKDEELTPIREVLEKFCEWIHEQGANPQEPLLIKVWWDDWPMDQR